MKRLLYHWILAPLYQFDEEKLQSARLSLEMQTTYYHHVWLKLKDKSEGNS